MNEVDFLHFFANQANFYVDRHIRRIVERSWNTFESVVLLGPRQIGKSTLAKTYFVEQLGAVYRDLEDELTKNEIGNGREFFRQHQDRIIILDEIQESPVLFRSVKVHIDEQRYEKGKKSKFLLLGSASLDLQRIYAKSLTGRSSQIQMTGVLLNELIQGLSDLFSLETDSHETKKSISNLVSLMLVRGGIPNSLFASSSDDSQQILTSIVETNVQNDLRSFGLNVDADKLFDCLNLIAMTNGQQYDLQRFARKLEFNRQEVTDSIRALEQLLLVRKLPPLNGFGKYEESLAKQPKLYIRDSGILCSRLDISSTDSLAGNRNIGEIWEGFVIESIIGVAISAGVYKDCRYFRTHIGDLELDMVLKLKDGTLWGIEIKHSETDQPTPNNIKAAEMINVDRKIMIHAGTEDIKRNGGFRGLPLYKVMTELECLGKAGIKGKSTS